jgi:hypothetical protein
MADDKRSDLSDSVSDIDMVAAQAARVEAILKTIGEDKEPSYRPRSTLSACEQDIDIDGAWAAWNS